MLWDNPRPHKPAPLLALHTRRVHSPSAADGRARVKLCPCARLRMLAPPQKHLQVFPLFHIVRILLGDVFHEHTLAVQAPVHPSAHCGSRASVLTLPPAV